MKPSLTYSKFKTVLNSLHFGEIEAAKGWHELVDLLVEKPGLRPFDHIRTHINYSFCDNSEFRREVKKDLAVGLVYLKPNGEQTCDTFVIDLKGIIKRAKNDKDLEKLCPELEWRHKVQVLKVN